MPNWCDNRLRVSGPTGAVREFIDGATSVDGHIAILHAYLPFPPGLDGKQIEDNGGKIIGKTFTDRGYTWCLANWGCKWGDTGGMVIDADINNDEGGMSAIAIYFTTPWGPPAEGMQRISAMFPELVFSLAFHEEGMGFAGGVQCSGGEMLRDIEATHPQWPEDEDEDKWSEELEEMYRTIFAGLAA